MFGLDLYDKFHLSLQDVLVNNSQLEQVNVGGAIFSSRTIRPANAISTDPNSLKGDALKRAILILATAMLADSSIDIDEFDERVKSFKESKAYKILATPQGEFYSFFNLQTTSLKAFYKIVHALRKKKYTQPEVLVLTHWS